MKSHVYTSCSSLKCAYLMEPQNALPKLCWSIPLTCIPHVHVHTSCSSLRCAYLMEGQNSSPKFCWSMALMRITHGATKFSTKVLLINASHVHTSWSHKLFTKVVLINASSLYMMKTSLDEDESYFFQFMNELKELVKPHATKFLTKILFWIALAFT